MNNPNPQMAENCRVTVRRTDMYIGKISIEYKVDGVTIVESSDGMLSFLVRPGKRTIECVSCAFRQLVPWSMAKGSYYYGRSEPVTHEFRVADDSELIVVADGLFEVKLNTKFHLIGHAIGRLFDSSGPVAGKPSTYPICIRTWVK